MKKTNAKMRKTSDKAAVNSQPLHINLLKHAVHKQVKPSEITFSPFNYRKTIAEDALQLFANELAQHGIISSLLVRPLANGQYELVSGERRLRAAVIAKLPMIPVRVAKLTDEQVIEIQLSENLQREDPHPLHEAQAIRNMQVAGKSIDEIAIRLGKSPKYVYVRLKLLNLVGAFQEMFFAGVITMQEALQIAMLSTSSQSEFYDERCGKWQQNKHFSLPNLHYLLNQYRYDLKEAPFNTKDRTLLPEAGACTACPNNSATLKTLFPESAKQAVCSNKECYHDKCALHLTALVKLAVDTHLPEALLFYNQPPESFEKIASRIPSIAALPCLNYYDLTILEKPVPPQEDDYCYNEDDNDDEQVTDQTEWQQAQDEFKEEHEYYERQLRSGQYKIGLLLTETAATSVHFSEQKSHLALHRGGGQRATAKQVQVAIKEGKATPDLLLSEIDRIRQQEHRAEELDREKVQLKVHEVFTHHAEQIVNSVNPTEADMAAAKLFLYLSLDYHTKRKVQEVLFPDSEEETEPHDQSVLFHFFTTISPCQFTFLIRMAIAGKSDSKYPTQEAGYCLYQVATQAGLPVQEMENEQQLRKAARKERIHEKITQLEKTISKLANKL